MNSSDTMTRQTEATLHLLCGNVASGKSTLAERLASQQGTVLLQEDALLFGLYVEEMATLKDFMRCSQRLRRTMSPHIVALLRSGMSVVLDFHANTRQSRRWMRTLIDEAGCRHQLHYFDTPVEVCRARLRLRNASRTHEFTVSEEDFDRIAAHFEVPGKDEDFNLKVHSVGD
ncbi:MAG: ATP-binding protein [Roseibium sp.]